MPTAGPIHHDDQNHAFVNPLEVHSFISQNRRTNADRTQLGIPEDEGEYHENLLNPDNTLNIVTVASQASWDRVSGTSHSPAYSMDDFVEKEDMPRSNQSFFESLLPMCTTSVIAPVQAVQGANTSCAQWNGPQPISTHITCLSSQQSQPGFPQHADLSMEDYPLGGSPIGSLSWIDSSAPVQETYGESYDTMSPFANSNLPLAPNAPRGPSPMRLLPRQLDNLQFSDPVSPQSDVLANANLAPQLDETRSDSLSAVCNRKRKRSGQASTPLRANLVKINGVRKVAACIRCRVLHEEVGFHRCQFRW